jgi:hypothetical protein
MTTATRDGLRVPASHPNTGKNLTPEERAILADLTAEVADLMEAHLLAAYNHEVADAQERARVRLEALPADAKSTGWAA